LKAARNRQSEELAALRIHVADAHQDTNNAERNSNYYLDQLMKDGKEIEALKEQDELL
jgi:hypothetical protein